MGIENNGFNINLKTIKSILLKIYENKPDFPIENKDILIEALGGKDQTYFVNDEVGEISASDLAEQSFKNRDNIEEPNQIIDAIIGDSFINIIAKSKCLEKIRKLEFPIDTKDKLTKNAKGLLVYGVPIDTIADKLDYPINKSDQIVNRIKMIDQNLAEANVELIIDISKSKKGLEKDEKKLKEEIKEEEGKEISLKEKIKKIIELGKNAYREKEFQRAIEIYNEGLALDPDNTELRFFKKQVQAKIVDSAIVKEDEGAGEAKAESAPGPGSELEPEPPSESRDQEPGDETAPPPEHAQELELDPNPNLDPDPDLQSAATHEPPTEELDSEIQEPFAGDAKGKSITEELDGSESKIEQLEKKLQEKVQALRNLAKPTKDLPEDACKSCEGLGDCYWCKGNGECTKCKSSGKTEAGEDCSECKGTGKCHSCQGTGKCHWCQGTGKKKE